MLVTKIIIGNEYIQVIKSQGNQVSVLGKIKTILRDIFIPFSVKYHHSIKKYIFFGNGTALIWEPIFEFSNIYSAINMNICMLK